MIHQSTKELNLQKTFLNSHILTQKMLHFSKNLVYNMCYEVLEQKFNKLESELKEVTKFDDIIKFHDNFLDECMKDSLLMEPSLLKGLTKINNGCLLFSRIIQNFTESMKFGDLFQNVFVFC